MSVSSDLRDDARAQGEKSSRATSNARGAIRGLLLRLHFYAGILVAPFILLVAVSGGLYAIAPQLEEIRYASELRTESQGDALPLADQVASALAIVDDPRTLAAVRPAPEPARTTRVLFEAGDVARDHHRAVFVDPVTGAVRGEQTVYGTSGALPVRTWLARLHSGAHLGTAGRLYSELAASWLWVVMLGGLVLWFDRWYRARQRGHPWVAPRERRGRLLGWHAMAGGWALAGVLVLAATGLTWTAGAGANIADLRSAAGWNPPELATDVPEASDELGVAVPADEVGMVNRADFDTVLRSAHDVGVTAGAVEIVPPSAPGRAWTVVEIDLAWPVQADAVAVHPETYAVVDQVRFADLPIMAKLATWGTAAHRGLLFGPVNQLVLFGLAAATVLVVCWGYAMWWRRRPTRGSRWAVGRPIPRGALRRAPMTVRAGAVTIAIAVSWFLPVLGVSLAVFLLIDVLLGRLHQARADRAGSDQPSAGS